jgi:hypothetical protein
MLALSMKHNFSGHKVHDLLIFLHNSNKAVVTCMDPIAVTAEEMIKVIAMDLLQLNLDKANGEADLLKANGEADLLKVNGEEDLLKVNGEADLLKANGEEDHLKANGEADLLKVSGAVHKVDMAVHHKVDMAVTADTVVAMVVMVVMEVMADTAMAAVAVRNKRQRLPDAHDGSNNAPGKLECS